MIDIDIGEMIKNALFDMMLSPFLVAVYIIIGISMIVQVSFVIYKNKKVKKRVQEIFEQSAFFAPTEIKNIRATMSDRNGPGVYVLHNTSKDMYYVGQGKKVMDRVASHFSGRGNGDVYADYKYGDAFAIKIVSLVNSGYQTLEKLEREVIFAYDAYEKGYNRNRGIRK